MIFGTLAACVKSKHGDSNQFEKLTEYDLQQDGNVIQCWIASTENEVSLALRVS